ncbi:MAG: arginine deiminase family protein [Bacteroidetes bacterium]|nr:arginine deiminase family protein [Bacteroidota bacterium]
MNNTLTCHSEYGKIDSIFIKKVKDAFVNKRTIKEQWASLNYLDEPNINKAIEEYHQFENLLKSVGSKLQYFPQNAQVGMDSMYCRDASIATNKGMILCQMGKAQRIKEPEVAAIAFKKKGIQILGKIEAPGSIEGGDVAWLDEKTLAVGHGYRSDHEGFRQLQELLTPLGVNCIQVQLPHYKGPSDVFHLMSIFSPIDKDLAVVYSPLMPVNFRNELISRGYDLVEVPEEEFESMGCNVLAIAPRVCLLVKGNPTTKAALQKAECTVLEYEGMEISVKGGGGPTCLTRPIWRQRHQGAN